MNIQDWAALSAAVATIAGTLALSIKWIVKHYLYELKSNGGSSVKDQVNRLEARIDQIFILLSEKE